ncbi:MAG: DUF554 domain-containing protein [Chloroflexi bacterium]|nr:DUF554 domain-containing protein [Chloroflexota bacterium]
MMGTLINVITILVGTGLGVFLGDRLKANLQETVLAGLGLITLVIGIQMALTTTNILIVLGSVLLGGMLGEWLGIEAALERAGEWLQQRFQADTEREDEATENGFVKGFVVASLLFAVGPLAILGSIQDGLTGDFRLLAIKATLDGFASLAFASSLGIGVGFSALTILIYQGGITLLAAQADALLNQAMINEMTATGGVLIISLAISSLLEIKTIRVGNLLPALLVAPLIVWLLTLFGLPLVPPI